VKRSALTIDLQSCGINLPSLNQAVKDAFTYAELGMASLNNQNRPTHVNELLINLFAPEELFPDNDPPDDIETPTDIGFLTSK
jgi:hypothetical protein